MLTLNITPEMRRKLEAALAEKGRCRLAAMSFSATAFLALDLAAEFRRTVVVVADSMHSLEEMRRNLLALAGAALAGVYPERILYYPAWEALPGKEDRRQTAGARRQKTAVQTEVVGERLQTLERLSALGGQPAVIATCVQALMQMTLAPAALKAHTFRLAPGEEHDPEALARNLEQAGYAFEPEVQARGQAAWRGGLLDVWALNEEAPFRIEFVGATVETIRSFDPASQRSFAREKEAVLPPVDEWNLIRALKLNAAHTAGHAGDEFCRLLMDYLPPELIYLWAEPMAGSWPSAAHHPTGIRYHAEIYQEALDEARVTDLTIPFDRVHQAIMENPRAWQCLPDPIFDTISTENAKRKEESGDGRAESAEPAVEEISLGGLAKRVRAVTGAATKLELPAHQPPAAGWPPNAERVDLGFRSVTGPADPRRDPSVGGLAPDIFAEHRRQWLASIIERARHGLGVHIFFYTQGALDRFREINPEPALNLHLGLLSDGFVQPELKLAVLSESNLLGRPKLLPDRAARAATARTRPSSRSAGAAAGETITDWTSLEPLDLVVHLDHGIGRYLGLYEIIFNGQRQEALAIEYADKAKLYVPVAQAHLLSRYVGVGKHAPNLHRLGSARWSREKDAAERAVRDLAADLLAIQAAREAKAGIAFPPDTPWQNEFEASFPYQETADQERAIHDVKHDMEASRPMDRLVCGDVG